MENSSLAIVSFINSITQIPPEEEFRFLKLLSPVTIKKGEFFIEEGQVPRYFGFVERGLFRYLYVHENGTEFTKNFMPENTFLSSYTSMIDQQPSKMWIQALEDSEVLKINYADWLRLKSGHPCWNRLLVAMLEKAFRVKESREREFLLCDATERYQIFVRQFPGLEARVKQHQIASYLGISPISLSRLRNKRVLT